MIYVYISYIRNTQYTIYIVVSPSIPPPPVLSLYVYVHVYVLCFTFYFFILSLYGFTLLPVATSS
jgi:hypothetical protein